MISDTLKWSFWVLLPLQIILCFGCRKRLLQFLPLILVAAGAALCGLMAWVLPKEEMVSLQFFIAAAFMVYPLAGVAAGWVLSLIGKGILRLQKKP